MEIYTNSKAADRTVFLPFPDTAIVSIIDVFVYKDGVNLFEIATVAPTPNEGFSAVIPLHLVQHDSDLKVHWVVTYTEDTQTFTTTKVIPVEIVTPILSKAEIKAIDPFVFNDDAEIVKIEKAVRHIIQSYTGQQFGYYIGTVSVRGAGGTALFLPRKLLSLDNINGSLNTTAYAVDPEGYVLRKQGWSGAYGSFDVPPVKADFYGLHMHVGGAIHDPNGVRYAHWNPEDTYSITGRWGYEEVPAQVKEAAKLLVNDYACADSQYRDRYLTSMTAADWRIQFNSGAFLRTGNVRADQLLSEYVVTRGWGVI